MTALGRTRLSGSLAVLAALLAILIASMAAPLSDRGAAGAGSSAGGVSAGGAPATPSRPTTPAQAAGPPAKRGVPGSVMMPAGHPLPDTVLAVIDGTRMVTVADFRSGWKNVPPPARSDTLTPQSAFQFLDLLIDKELLAARAIQETWEWSAVESAGVVSLRDRTMMRVALDSALIATARARAVRGDKALSLEALGVAARESTVARLHMSCDELLLARLATAWTALPKPSADSSLWSRMKTMGQMPSIEPGDSARVVAWSDAGTVRVSELLDAWAKLNPIFRPRIRSPEQVRDLVKNALFERVLRRQAQQDHYEQHPTVLRAVRRQEEYLASQYFVGREVFASIPLDEPTLRRYYDRNPAAWAIPTRLRVVRMVMPDRPEGSRVAVMLRDQAEADTLVARGMRRHSDFTAEITAASDSALFKAAMKSGTGTVLGPDSVAGGWQVVRVNAVLPAQSRTFEEVKDLVLRAWSDEEGERRMQELLAGLRKRAKIVVNRPPLDKLVAAAPKPKPPTGKAP